MKLPHRRQFLHLAAGAAALPAVVPVANAQTYPTRPVSIVVPFPAGGGTDIVGRIIAERMSISLGRPVIIENISGANGSIGARRIARAAPDGYAILLAPSGMFVVEPALKPLPYDVVHDFEPITLLTTQPYMVVARRTMPADDLSSLIAWLRANPDKATAATIGTGGPPQIGGIFFQKATETRFQFVSYRGGADQGAIERVDHDYRRYLLTELRLNCRDERDLISDEIDRHIKEIKRYRLMIFCEVFLPPCFDALCKAAPAFESEIHNRALLDAPASIGPAERDVHEQIEGPE